MCSSSSSRLSSSTRAASTPPTECVPRARAGLVEPELSDRSSDDASARDRSIPRLPLQPAVVAARARRAAPQLRARLRRQLLQRHARAPFHLTRCTACTPFNRVIPRFKGCTLSKCTLFTPIRFLHMYEGHHKSIRIDLISRNPSNRFLISNIICKHIGIFLLSGKFY